MGTFRCDARIARPPEELWAVVADIGAVADWFPSMRSSEAVEGGRTVVLGSGLALFEETVTLDGRLRRYQYRIAGGVGISEYLGTVDVLDDGDGASHLVYSGDVRPDAMTFVLQGAVAEAVTHLGSVLGSEASATPRTVRTADTPGS